MNPMSLLHLHHISSWTGYISSTHQPHGASDYRIYCIEQSRSSASKQSQRPNGIKKYGDQQREYSQYFITTLYGV